MIARYTAVVVLVHSVVLVREYAAENLYEDQFTTVQAKYLLVTHDSHSEIIMMRTYLSLKELIYFFVNI